MGDIPELKEFVIQLLHEKHHPIELYGPSVNKHCDEPVQYLPARDGCMLQGLTWWYGLMVDLKKAQVRISCDYVPAEVGLRKGWLQAIDAAVREQVFAGVSFYLMPRSGYHDPHKQSVRIVPDRDVDEIVGHGSLMVPYDQLFPADSREHAAVMAVYQHWEAVRQAEWADRAAKQALDLTQTEEMAVAAIATL